MKFPLRVHLAITLVWMILALYLIFLYAPQETTMGEVQRIFYIHFQQHLVVGRLAQEGSALGLERFQFRRRLFFRPTHDRSDP